MEILSIVLIVSVANLAFANIGGIEECECLSNPLPHPKHCYVQYLALVNITGTSKSTSKRYYNYQLVADISQSNSDNYSLKKWNTFETALTSAECGAESMPYGLILIGGRFTPSTGHPHIHLCTSYFRRWKLTGNASKEELVRLQEECRRLRNY